MLKKDIQAKNTTIDELKSCYGILEDKLVTLEQYNCIAINEKQLYTSSQSQNNYIEFR
jgi:hypothetical protein